MRQMHHEHGCSPSRALSAVVDIAHLFWEGAALFGIAHLNQISLHFLIHDESFLLLTHGDHWRYWRYHVCRHMDVSCTIVDW